MRRAAAALMLSAIMAFAAVSVCAPFNDAQESDSVSIIVPSDELSIEDPLGLILGFEYLSAEVGRADGTVLILMTGAPYEDDEIFVAVTEAIGPDLFITSTDLGALGKFEVVVDEAPVPPEKPFGDGVDLDFLEKILMFVESSMRWAMLADDLETEILIQERFSSKMIANCVYWDSRSCEVGSDRREDDPADSDHVEPVILEDSDEGLSETPVFVEHHLPVELLSEVGDPGDLPVIGRGTVI